MKKLFYTFLLFLICASIANAQVTTSSLSGNITDQQGDEMVGATVIATHTPSGTTYGTTTDLNGNYLIPNMRIGGPYSVVVSFVGYQKSVTNDVHLRLGQRENLDVELQSGVELEQVTITADQDALINPNKTGASTSISSDQLETLPTITRSAADLTRLNPMSAEGGSFGGRNDQFNNYSLDGSIFNNPFGLDAATPGGQADAQPVSLDAIEQISVALAPYDVTKAGFTGASVDAVTKSGTNDIKGSVFGYFRNADMTGGKVEDTEVIKGDLEQIQGGVSIGGPIVKNKAFYFLNFEIERRSDLGSFFVPDNGQEGSNVSRVLESDMMMVSNLLRDVHGYETGAVTGFKHDINNEKWLAKFNFNLSQDHKLAVTYNGLNAFKEQPAHPSAIGRRGPDFLTLQFENSGYRINNKIHSGKAELNSILGQNLSNKLQVGYTAFRDSRDPFSDPFPVLNFSKDGIRYIVAGHEPFSINNILDQDVIQASNNLSIYKNNHNFTIGTSFERFAFDNSFNLTGYGARVFFPDVDIADAANFINSPEFADEVQAARDAFAANSASSDYADHSWALAETNLGQWALYAQDEISVNDQLNVTIGIRGDLPLYFDTEEKMQENIDRNCCYDPSIQYYDESGNPLMLNSLEFPEQKPLISPRLGFNYDINNDGTSQLRGGTGLFSGRFPFVWVGNQVANPNSFFYVTTAPDFKYPQVWRSNVGFDKTFNGGWELSTDVIYTDDIQAAMVRNYGLQLPTGELQGVDNRPIYIGDEHGNNAYVFTNTSEGYSLNTSFTVKKELSESSYFTVAYNFLDSKDAASIDAEISSDAYDRNPANITHSNEAELAPSLYGNKHRVVGSGYKKFAHSDRSSTHIGIFTEYVEGGRYSFTYAGDINNDGSGLNDLIYIPTEAELNSMNFTNADQRTAFNNYIEQDDYLSEHRGEYAEKYGSVNPWYGKWDARIMQEFGFSNASNIQLSLDILNIGNLISSDWGIREIATNTGLVQPISVAVDENGVPTYSFDTSQTSTVMNDFGLRSRWQMQLGLRYNF